MTNLEVLTQRNTARWFAAKIRRDASEVARRLCAAPAKARYQVIARQTAVPWFIIAIIHYREASQSWMANLAQGDRWDRVSVHVPKGRGPFRSFEAAAIDALVNCSPHAARWHDWSAGGALTLLELYNGLGYAARQLPSPYVGAGTDQYAKGKFVADGVFDPDVVDKQLGCACILKAMMAIDPAISFTGAILSPRPPPAPMPQPQPSPQPSFWAAIFSTITSVFRRKP
jgi:lysozyme family protein